MTGERRATNDMAAFELPRPKTSKVTESAPNSAPVMEVFASIQGEGLHVGRPQTFVRLRGCPLRCNYCDTPGSWSLPARGLDEQGQVDEDADDSWLTPFALACRIAEVEQAAPELCHTAISVTGGEPTVWPDYLWALRNLLSERRLHLETAGPDPVVLSKLLGAFQHISLDLKHGRDMDPPELGFDAKVGASTGSRDLILPDSESRWSAVREENLKTLAAWLASNSDVDAAAKIVLTQKTDEEQEEFEDAGHAYGTLLEQVSQFAPGLPVILQPATPLGSVSTPPRELVDELVAHALDLKLDVRVLPQVHRQLKMR